MTKWANAEHLPILSLVSFKYLSILDAFQRLFYPTVIEQNRQANGICRGAIHCTLVGTYKGNNYESEYYKEQTANVFDPDLNDVFVYCLWRR